MNVIAARHRVGGAPARASSASGAGAIAAGAGLGTVVGSVAAFALSRAVTLSPALRAGVVGAGLVVGAGIGLVAHMHAGRPSHRVPLDHRPPPFGPSDPGGPGLDVSGNRITNDGRPFEVRGLNFAGTLAADGVESGHAVRGNATWGPDELAAARRWGANTLRFQINQHVLAGPEDAARTYLEQMVIPHVQQAQEAGFEVILSMQDERFGDGESHPAPSWKTELAWDRVADTLEGPLRAQSPDVMLELYNEPRTNSTAAGWQQWRDGGEVPGSAITTERNKGDLPVGHQTLVDELRARGVDNVLIAEGAGLGHTLDGAPLLDDPREHDRIAYGVHLYRFAEDRDWDATFGDRSLQRPVIDTEWSYGKHASDAQLELAPKLLDYSRAHGVGTIAGSFDDPMGSHIMHGHWNPRGSGSGTVVWNYLHSPVADERPNSPAA